jgi:hypothetical protein
MAPLDVQLHGTIHVFGKTFFDSGEAERNTSLLLAEPILISSLED